MRLMYPTLTCFLAEEHDIVLFGTVHDTIFGKGTSPQIRLLLSTNSLPCVQVGPDFAESILRKSLLEYRHRSYPKKRE